VLESTVNSVFAQISICLLFSTWLIFNAVRFFRDEKWYADYIKTLKKKYSELTFDEKEVVQKKKLRSFGTFLLTGVIMAFISIVIGGICYGWLFK
jgi:hypothetical protein